VGSALFREYREGVIQVLLAAILILKILSGINDPKQQKKIKLQ